MCVFPLVCDMITKANFGNYHLDMHISVSSIFIQPLSNETSPKVERVVKDEVQAPPRTNAAIRKAEELSEDPQSPALPAQVSCLKLTKKLVVVNILLSSQ